VAKNVKLPSTIHHNKFIMTITPTFCYSHCPLSRTGITVAQ